MKKYPVLAILISSLSQAEESPVKFGGFIDTYYAYDFNDPRSREREFTTQPVRHNEFNVNLAYLDAVLDRTDTRGRISLQYGNSVTKNTTGEPKEGATSGASDSKMFQEAYVGKRIGEKTWLDAGIFLGNIGGESWISKDNWTYTRALNLDYVPYYSSGIRLEHKWSDRQSGQIQILNGWQNMSENNNGKAIGMQFRQIMTPGLTFTYNNFFGDEEVVNPRPRFRGYHNFIFQWVPRNEWSFLAAVDFGHQSQQSSGGVDGWGAATLTVRRILSEIKSVALRGEYYCDPHQSNVATKTKNGFRVLGLSFNYDQKLDPSTLWRTELRGFSSEDRIYPAGKKGLKRSDGFIVTSLSAWF